MTLLGLTPIRRRFARSARLAPLLALALALSGCLFNSTPATPTPVPPTPTPLPTATPTEQQRVAFPTAPAVPTSTAIPAPAPSPTPIPELRDAGQLLYIGVLDGKPGVIAVNADGSGRRLLVEGLYDELAWSPDGRRFAASGTQGNGPSRVGLYTAEGRPLRGVTFEGRAGQIIWSPDSRQVALQTFIQGPYGPNGSPSGLGSATAWLLREDGAREIALDGQANPLSWSPGGRLALWIYRDSDGDRRYSEADEQGIWTVDVEGGDTRQLFGNHAHPLGWSADGATLYVGGDFQPYDAGGAQTYTGPTSLLALDAATGDRRVIATIEGVVAQVVPDGQRERYRWMGGAELAPGGGLFALWLGIPQAAYSDANPPRWLLVVIDPNGRVVWRDEPPIGGMYGAWSPDGARLVYPFARRNGAGFVSSSGLHVANVRTGETFELGGEYGQDYAALHWSPDGRWLAIEQFGRVEIVATGAPARSWILARDGRSLAWRPATRP